MKIGPAAFVVDASVSAAWLLADEATEASDAALMATATKDVWVPALWTIEMANLLVSAQRRRRITGEKRRDLTDRLAALRVKVDREPVGMAELGNLAERYRLTAYDAVYLELALRRRLPVATRDQALLAAMVSTGIGHCFADS